MWLGVNRYLKFIVFNMLNLEPIRTVSINLLVRVTGSKLVVKRKSQIAL